MAKKTILRGLTKEKAEQIVGVYKIPPVTATDMEILPEDGGTFRIDGVLTAETVPTKQA